MGFGIRWSAEEKSYLTEITPGRSYREIAVLMSGRFDREFTVEQIKGAIQRYCLNTGRTGRFKKGTIPPNKGKNLGRNGISLESQARSRATIFKPGNRPANYRPVGSERVDSKDGYVYVKVADRRDPNGYNDHRDLWKLKHRVIWEQANGPLPEGHIIIFCDRDIYNFDINNLMCVSQETHGLLKLKKIEYWDRGSAEVAVATAQLMHAIKKVSCCDRECKKCGSTFLPRYSHQKTCDVCLGRLEK